MSSAVDLFADVGYQATGLGDIIDRAAMTKGALYYHFASKAELATAIIEEGAATALTAFRDIGEPSVPALEHMIRGVFVVAELVRTDKMVRTGAQLIRAFGEFNEATVPTHGLLAAEMADKAREAIAEGDIRADQDPDSIAEVIVSAMLGAELISNVSSSGSDLVERVAQTWQLLLPALATEESLPRYREFVAEESLRHVPPEPLGLPPVE